MSIRIKLFCSQHKLYNSETSLKRYRKRLIQWGALNFEKTHYFEKHIYKTSIIFSIAPNTLVQVLKLVLVK